MEEKKVPSSYRESLLRTDSKTVRNWNKQYHYAYITQSRKWLLLNIVNLLNANALIIILDVPYENNEHEHNS